MGEGLVEAGVAEVWDFSRIIPPQRIRVAPEMEMRGRREFLAELEIGVEKVDGVTEIPRDWSWLI